MRAALPLFLMLCAPAVASAQEERPARAVPVLSKAPKFQGGLKGLASPLVLKPTATPGASASFTAKAGFRKDTLFVGVEATDDQLGATDLLTVSLFFPGAGPTATGYTWRFAFDGKRPSGADSGTPPFAQEKVDAAVERRGNTLVLMAAFPVRAFPRFPATDPLVMDLCITYEDADGAGGKAVPVSNCRSGAMEGEALRLPDDARKALKLKPPEAVTALEAAKDGWLGWDLLSYPAWAEGDAALTPASLRALVAPGALDAARAGVEVPDTLSLPDGRPVVTVLTGKNPYAVAGRCDAESELRLGLYLVTGKTARRVLEWPAATCALGRAASMELDEEGALTIGYSNGATMNFAWSGDHFERTELGKR
ncbi:CBM9 family sugar-binding protein [Myxococcus sp. RHSTA-1-4]|uniref:CBM9 family sugar-binding protein n=1 Tax=Myxococcus sp. RHSTA-1-4 TaxID=2874601 RepID=UPI001CC1BE69|nr:CBM9 family sugar-binding protein [Myxococcus sp. RHSTA-1-4]MBZ4421170.1 CBM9 family sugar-binding protein [Myxococcus sp. RHSTA-1-4]